MVARYFTPQQGLKGWSECGDISGVAHITKGRGQGHCSITIHSLYIKDRQQSSAAVLLKSQ